MIGILALLVLQTAAQAAPPSAIEKPKLICRADDQMVGTRIHSGRRCKTAEEWQQEDSRRSQIPTTLRIMPTDGGAIQPPQHPPL